MNYWALLAVAVIGGLVGFAKFKHDSAKRRTPLKTVDFGELVENQLVVDTLTATEIVNGFKSAEVSGEWIIAKPTAKVAKRFGLTNLPAQVDAEKNFLQLVTTQRGEILKASLISFSALDENLAKILPFGQEDFVFIDKSRVS
ncbi:MAG: hypothetical protein SR1Q7_03220 [Quinella sp. 1Q7]|nr:hypothetical protein [Quinella sp. 1Q7]